MALRIARRRRGAAQAGRGGTSCTPSSIVILLIEMADLEAKLQWLLNTYDLWSEEGYFAFPDGTIYWKDQP